MKKEYVKSCILLLVVAAALLFTIQHISLLSGAILRLLSILRPILLGMAVAFILYNPYMFFHRFYTKLITNKAKVLIPALSILSVYLCVFAVIGGIFAFIIPQLSDSIRTLYANIGVYSTTLQEFTLTMVRRLHLNSIELSSIQNVVADIPKLFKGALSAMFPALFSMTTSFIRVIIDTIIALVIGAYILTDKPRLKRHATSLVHAYLPRSAAKKLFYIGTVAFNTFSRFLVGQITEAFILGGLCFVGMLVFRFEYALLISVLIGVTSLIPIVGAFVGAIPAVLLLLMVDPPRAMWFIVFILVLQQFEGDIIYPRVVGQSIGLPSIWVMVAIILGGGLAGVTGMLISVPTMSVIYQLTGDAVDNRLQTRQ